MCGRVVSIISIHSPASSGEGIHSNGTAAVVCQYRHLYSYPSAFRYPNACTNIDFHLNSNANAETGTNTNPRSLYSAACQR